MKNMMKKTLSVIIALAMILVPMSVFAAAGDPVAVPSWEYCIYSGSTVTVGAGETIYFEISTEGSDATLDFIVEGAGDFDVTVCTEDGAGAYLDGTPVSAVNGKVETTITGFASTYYYCAFAITNNSADAVDYTCTIVFPQGSQSNPYPITLAVGGTATVTVPAYAEYYVAATLPEQYIDYQLTITGNTGFGISEGYMPTWDNNGTYVGTVASYWGPASICILNNTDSEQTYTFALDNMPLGAQSNPDALPVNETVTKDLVNQEYWYTWTAEEDGTFTFEMDNALCADGWTYNLQHNYDVYNFSTGWGESDKNVCEVTVVAGDTILLGVSIPTYNADIDYYDVYTPASGTVVFTTTFSTGDDNQGGGDIGGGDEGDEDGVNYVNSDTLLVVGDNACVVDGGYEYTIYTFEPTEEGEYTITSDDSVMGIVSANGMWVTVEPSADTVNANELVWECTGVGQSIWVAVKADTNVANITITRAELDTSDEIPWVDYENMETPEAFTFEDDADKLVYVDVEDDVDDNMNVYYNDEDGYYHYGAEDGPIIYVNLDESMMSMVGVVSNGKLVGANYDIESGEVTEYVNCTNAIMEYIAAADTVETADGTLTLYPLTDDLIVMYIACGDYMGWYGEDGWLGLDTPDAWMFACYYVDEVPGGSNEGNEGEDNTGDDNTGDIAGDNAGDNAGDDNTGNVADPEIPNTDNEAFGVAIAMMATAAALGATVVTTKKSKRVK